MIDPLETIIAYLDSQPELVALVEQRIAARHRFAMTDQEGWPTPAKALQLRLVPGAVPDLYGGTSRVRVEVRCFGEEQHDAMAVYRALMDVLAATRRTVVTLSGGERALLYYLIPEFGSPELGMEPDTKVNLALVYLSASVAHQAV